MHAQQQFHNGYALEREYEGIAQIPAIRRKNGRNKESHKGYPKKKHALLL
jgi:hypothetical protein